MSNNLQNPIVVTSQPQTVLVVNPFDDLNQEWSTDLFDCCDDIGDCK